MQQCQQAAAPLARGGWAVQLHMMAHQVGQIGCMYPASGGGGTYSGRGPSSPAGSGAISGAAAVAAADDRLLVVLLLPRRLATPPPVVPGVLLADLVALPPEAGVLALADLRAGVLAADLP